MQTYVRHRDGATVDAAEAMENGALRTGYGVRVASMFVDSQPPAGGVTLFDTSAIGSVPASVHVSDRAALTSLADRVHRAKDADEAGAIRRAAFAEHNLIRGRLERDRQSLAFGSLTDAGAQEVRDAEPGMLAAMAWLEGVISAADRVLAADVTTPAYAAGTADGAYDQARADLSRAWQA